MSPFTSKPPVDLWEFPPTFLVLSYAMWGRKIARELKSK